MYAGLSRKNMKTKSLEYFIYDFTWDQSDYCSFNVMLILLKWPLSSVNGLTFTSFLTHCSLGSATVLYLLRIENCKVKAENCKLKTVKMHQFDTISLRLGALILVTINVSLNWDIRQPWMKINQPSILLNIPTSLKAFWNWLGTISFYTSQA